MRQFITGSLTFLLLACSSDVPDYYTLTDVSGTPYSGKKIIIEVQKPGLDQTLDRPQMVREGDVRLMYDNKAMWSEPLNKMVERVVAGDLGQRLPDSSVTTESGGISARPDYLVALDIRKFGTNSKGQAALEIMLTLNKPASSGKPVLVVLSEPAPASAADQVKALSRLVAQLSDRIAQDIVSHYAH